MSCDFCLFSSPGLWVMEYMLIPKARRYSSIASIFTLLKINHSFPYQLTKPFSLYIIVYYSYYCSNKASRFTGTITGRLMERPTQSIHFVCPTIPGLDWLYPPRSKSCFPCFCQTFFNTRLYTPSQWSSSHEGSPYWVPWSAFCSIIQPVLFPQFWRLLVAITEWQI